MREFSVQIKRALETEILSGWKEIASYLGKGVRTVQRYERVLGLPIHHPSGRVGMVIATKVELDAWVAATPFRETFLLRQGPAKVIEARVALWELKTQLEELRRLRAETSELRKTMTESLESLRASLRESLTETSAVFSLPSKKIQ